MSQGEFVGVDGCPHGWFSVGLDGNGDLAGHCVFGSFTELLDHHADAGLVLVDMPIGLPESSGGRECDKEARQKLNPPRASSVFPAPTRQAVQVAVDSRDYNAASEAECKVSGKRLTRQTFNIACKIAEVDEALRCRGADARPQVREVHPEVCFWAMNNCRPMKVSKKKSDKTTGFMGEEDRIRVLECYLPQVRSLYYGLVAEFPRKQVAKDDILDAMAAAVTGWLAGSGRGRLATLPSEPPRDAKDLPMEMVYCEPLCPAGG